MSLLRAWVGPLLVAAAAVAMAIFTWGTWPDPIVDFGKEVYIAWQLSEGRRLYVDVAYHLGPLSPYFNALAFKLFGPTLATIEWLNLSLLAVMIVLIYRLIHRAAGELAAAAAGITFVCLFAFTHFTQIADYNFICPYDHAHTHGILLGLIGLTAAENYRRTRQPWALATAGLAIGLAFLTRAELFLADAVGVITLLAFSRRSLGVLESWRSILLFAGAFLAPILITLLLLGPRAVLGSWPTVFDTSVAANPFYRDSMGTLHIGDSLLRLLRWTVCWSAILLPPLAVSRLKTHTNFWIIAALAWGAAGTYLAGHLQDPADAFAPLPVALIAVLWVAWRKRGGEFSLSAGLIVWALVLLGKIVLNARIVHYGFALAMPATLMVVAAGVGWTRPVARAGVLGALVVTIIAHLGLAARLQAKQTFVVGEGSDSFLADERGGMLNECLTALRQLASPGQTLAVMPEGAILNFLAKMPNSTPYWSYNPPYSFFAPGQGEAAGQAQILHALETHPPDWIVLVPEDLSDSGTPYFGRDYGLDLYSFVQRNYSPNQEWGPPRFILLRRKVYNEAAPQFGAGEPDAVSTGG